VVKQASATPTGFGANRSSVDSRCDKSRSCSMSVAKPPSPRDEKAQTQRQGWNPVPGAIVMHGSLVGRAIAEPSPANSLCQLINGLNETQVTHRGQVPGARIYGTQRKTRVLIEKPTRCSTSHIDNRIRPPNLA